MSEGNGAAAPATPANFEANIAARNAPAATPAPAPAAASATPPPGITHGVPAPANAPTEDPAAVFNAALQAANQPANDNAIDPSSDPALAAIQAEQQQGQADPFAEEVHGLQLRAIVDAIKNGQLPNEVLEHVKVTAKVNGRELPISVREAANGYMRLSDYTQSTQRVAQEQQQVEAIKAQLRGVFEGWDKPEGYEQAMFRMGLVPQMRATLTKNWGTPQQPNVQGFLDDMRRLGHWDTFVAAADTFGMQWGAEQKLDPGVRAELERQRSEMWKARLAAEAEVEQNKLKAWQAERDQLLRAREQQRNPQERQQVQQKMEAMRAEAFTKHGIPNTPGARKTYEDNRDALIRLARQRGQGLTMEQLVADAVQATQEQLGDALHELRSRQPAQQQSAAPQQQPAAQGALPARPAAAPATTASPISRRGTPDEFWNTRIVPLQQMAGKR